MPVQKERSISPITIDLIILLLPKRRKARLENVLHEPERRTLLDELPGMQREVPLVAALDALPRDAEHLPRRCKGALSVHVERW